MKIAFDTRDKKPKLYGLLIQAVLVLAAVAVLLLSGAEKHAVLASALLTAFTLAAAVQLMIAWFGQLKYNPYSYNTIYYIGFALFLLALFLLEIRVLTQQIRSPEAVSAEGILYTLLGSAKTYILLSFPFILVFSAALCISNISLIRHEGKRLVNVLGILLAFLLLGGEIFLFIFDFAVSGGQREVMFHDLFTNFFASVYLYLECMLIGTMVAGAITARSEPDPDRDFIIILGCRLQPDGTPTPLLRGRIDRALAFARKQKEISGKDVIFVTSGGQGADEAVSESESMKRYLLKQGVPEERIVKEDASTDTFENMKFSKEKILAREPAGKVAFSTTNYHVFRSGLMARRVKMKAIGVGAKTKWYYWPNAAVREFVGLLTQHKGKQAAVLGALLAAYMIMTLIVYR